MKREQDSAFVHFEPRHPTLWAAVAYLACTFSLAWPALIGRFLVNANSDQFLAGYAFRSFAVEQFKSTGKIPLWEPYLLGGMPFVGAMHGDIFYPTFWLRLILPVDVAMSWGMIAHFFFCGMATYWFLRVAAKMSFLGALVGGVAYMMTGFVSSLVSAGHDGKLFVNALFPVLLLVIHLTIRGGKSWGPGALSLVTGLILLTPHPQLFEQVMLVGAAWALYLAFSGEGAAKLANNVAMKRLALALVAVGIGVAIGSIQYMPAAEYKPWSPRAESFDYAKATSYSFPLEELINLYLPQFSGILENYWGRNAIHLHSEYAGVAVLMLAGLGFGAAANAARKSFQRFWLWTGVGALLWALGGSTPFYHIIYALVPLVSHMRAPSTIFYIVTFAVAVFAAAGTERLISNGVNRGYLVGWAVFGGVVTLLAISGGLSNLASALLQIPPFADRIPAGAADLKVGAVRSLAVLLVTIALFRAIAAGKLRGWQGGMLLAALCAADLWSIERMYWGSVPAAATSWASDPTIEYLKKAPGPFRVLAVATGGGQAIGPDDPYLNGSTEDGLMVHGIRSMLGYHGNEIARYKDNISTDPRGFLNPTTWALTNTKYLLLNDSSFDIPGAKRIMTAKNAAGTLASLYELPGDNTFAWVTPVLTKYPEDATIEALRQPNFPVRSVAVVPPSANVPDVKLSAIPAPLAIKVNTTKYEPGHVSLELSDPAPAGAALVVSENYYPGWVATVDGKPATTERTDLVLLGVPLTAGAKKVELTFTSPPYERGKLLTEIALAVAIMWTAAAVVMGRRATPAGSAA